MNNAWSRLSQTLLVCCVAVYQKSTRSFLSSETNTDGESSASYCSFPSSTHHNTTWYWCVIEASAPEATLNEDDEGDDDDENDDTKQRDMQDTSTLAPAVRASPAALKPLASTNDAHSITNRHGSVTRGNELGPLGVASTGSALYSARVAGSSSTTSSTRASASGTPSGNVWLANFSGSASGASVYLAAGGVPVTTSLTGSAASAGGGATGAAGAIQPNAVRVGARSPSGTFARTLSGSKVVPIVHLVSSMGQSLFHRLVPGCSLS